MVRPQGQLLPRTQGAGKTRRPGHPHIRAYDVEKEGDRRPSGQGPGSCGKQSLLRILHTRDAQGIHRLLRRKIPGPLHLESRHPQPHHRSRTPDERLHAGRIHPRRGPHLPHRDQRQTP